MTQQELGTILLVGARTVSRYEKGQHPATPVLLILESLATHQAQSLALAALFRAARHSGIAARSENLSSPGSAPRIPVQELRYWSRAQKEIILLSQNINWAIANGTAQLEHVSNLVMNILHRAHQVQDQLEPYIPNTDNQVTADDI